MTVVLVCLWKLTIFALQPGRGRKREGDAVSYRAGGTISGTWLHRIRDHAGALAMIFGVPQRVIWVGMVHRCWWECFVWLFVVDADPGEPYRLPASGVRGRERH
jgi:hypothetical protein